MLQNVISYFSPAWQSVCRAVGSVMPGQQQLRCMMSVLLMCFVTFAFAQTTSTSEALNEGINQFGGAVETMQQFVPIIKNLCYILAVIFGLVGGVLIVIAMNNHEQDVNKKIAMTVGAVVFMLVIAQAIPLIFGVGADS